jgi:predicted ArsR family transcriptional regulator
MKIMENNEIMGEKKSISIKNQQIILDNCPWIAKKYRVPGTGKYK